MIEIKRLTKGDEIQVQEIVARFSPKSKFNERFLAGEGNYLLAAYVDDAFAGLKPKGKTRDRAGYARLHAHKARHVESS